MSRSLCGRKFETAENAGGIDYGGAGRGAVECVHAVGFLYHTWDMPIWGGGFFLWGDGADRALGLFFSYEYYYCELNNFDETGVRNY